MDFSGQPKIYYSYSSDDTSGLTTVSFTGEGGVVLGTLVLESTKLKSFFAALSSVFSERSKALQTPKSSESIMKLLNRVHSGEGEIGYTP